MRRRRDGGTLPAISIALAVLALASGCGPKPVFRTGDREERSARAGTGRPAAAGPERPRHKGLVEEVASAWIGTPYRYGGTDERGIDCSALVQNVMGDLGTGLPRTTRAQRAAGRSVSRSDVLPGDLLFFRVESSRVNHVGIALDPDRFIHASASRGVVVDRLMDDYFARRFVEARRVMPDP